MPKTKKNMKVYIKKKKSMKKQTKQTNLPKHVDNENIMARCMKCRQQMKMLKAKQVTLKNGRTAMKGNCDCGTKMFKFV